MITEELKSIYMKLDHLNCCSRSKDLIRASLRIIARLSQKKRDEEVLFIINGIECPEDGYELEMFKDFDENCWTYRDRFKKFMEAK